MEKPIFRDLVTEMASKQQIIFGRHPVMETIKRGISIDKVLLQSGTRGPFEKELRQICKHHKISLQNVPKERLDRMTKSNHQGIIAFLSLLEYNALEDLLPMIYEQSRSPLFLLLDRITDVRNFGAIARSAEISGVHGIVIGKKGAAQINAEAIKASAGALTKIPVCRESSLSSAIDLLKQSGVQVLASELKASRYIFEVDLSLPTAIILGSEDKGVHPELIKQADQRILIPQMGTTDSFNVSVASGIILYEVMRQRMS